MASQEKYEREHPELKGACKPFFENKLNQTEPFFQKEIPRAGWAFVGRELIPDTENRNFIEQTEIIISYWKEFFKDRLMPKELADAIREFESKKTELQSMLKDESLKAGAEIENLAITRLTRPLPTELYLNDTLTVLQTGEHTLPTCHALTARRDSFGGFIQIGNMSDAGTQIFPLLPRQASAYDTGTLPFLMLSPNAEEQITFPKEALGLNEVRELFGNDFIGIEEAERFTGRPLTPEEKRTAEEKWQKKIEEQGLTKEGLEQLKQEGFMVVLRVGTLAGKEKKDKEIPVTIKNLREKFPLFYNQDWYNGEKFADETLGGIDWGIVKKELLDETRRKNWDEQQEILKTWAETHGVPEKFVRRRTPTEVAYDVLAYFQTRNERILEKDWDWTSVQSSGGKFVGVGSFGSGGLRANSDARVRRYSHLGVCPAR